jgi:hypothetical protein
MTDSEPLLIRHIVPVLAGGAVVLLLTIVTDSTLSAHGAIGTAEGGVPTTGSLALMTAYRALFATVGCHLAGRLAPTGNPRMRYAMALGALLLLLTIVSAIGTRGQLPAWYAIANIALTFPCAIIGGGTAVRVMARAGQPR